MTVPENGVRADSPQGVAALGADLAASGERAVRALLTVRFWAVVLFRVSQSLGAVHPVLGGLARQVNHVLTGADLAWPARIGPGLVLHHPTGVVIGPYVRVGRHAQLQQGVTLGGDGGADGGAGTSPVLGDRVSIGAGARVFGAIRLGDDVVVGANAVVIRDVPAGRTVVGVPAREI